MKKAFSAIIRSGCSWWCRGRFVADHIQAHPRLGAAIRVVQAANRVAHVGGRVLNLCAKQHAEQLGSRPCRITRGEGVVVQVLEGEANDDVQGAAGKANEAFRRAGTYEARAGDEGCFTTNTPIGMHAIRVCARVRAIAEVQKSRWESERGR